MPRPDGPAAAISMAGWALRGVTVPISCRVFLPRLCLPSGSLIVRASSRRDTFPIRGGASGCPCSDIPVRLYHCGKASLPAASRPSLPVGPEHHSYDRIGRRTVATGVLASLYGDADGSPEVAVAVEQPSSTKAALLIVCTACKFPYSSLMRSHASRQSEHCRR